MESKDLNSIKNAYLHLIKEDNDNDESKDNDSIGKGKSLEELKDLNDDKKNAQR